MLRSRRLRGCAVGVPDSLYFSCHEGVQACEVVMRERGIKSRHGIGLLSENAILPRRILQYAVYEQEKIEVIWLGEWRWVVLDVE